MPARKAELTKLAREDLMHYIAVNGENYEKYVKFAEQRGFYVFSRRYLHTWVGRHRQQIQLLRRQHLVEVKRISVMDRQARLGYLEANARKLDDKIENEEDPDRVLRMMETQRKLLQAIAQERGEWNTKDEGVSEMQELHDRLLERMKAAEMKALPDPDVIEGEVTEI